MECSTKFAIVLDEELPVWKKLNVAAFLSSGIVSNNPNIIGKNYQDKSGVNYLPLCIQPIIVLKASRGKLNTFLARAKNSGVDVAVFIDDMFTSGHDEANRATVNQYYSDELPLVGIAIHEERKVIDKILKGAKLQD
jgi:hypothetical protein